MVRMETDIALDDGRVLLGILLQIPFPLPGADQRNFRIDDNPVAPIRLPDIKDRKNRSLGSHGQKGQSHMGAGLLSEKVNEYPFLPGHILIQKDAQAFAFS